MSVPNAVLYSIYNTYPDYTIVNDKYLYTQEEGILKKNNITLKLKEGDAKTSIQTVKL
jgi:hypothetical protein